MRGLATLPKGNQETVVVKTRLKDPGEFGVSMSVECDTFFHFSAFTVLVG